jgi:hypothetical protein
MENTMSGGETVDTSTEWSVMEEDVYVTGVPPIDADVPEVLSRIEAEVERVSATSENTNTTNNMESESMSNEPTRDSHSSNGIEIHSNIPVPSSVGVRGVRSRYPLMEMEIGDCFFVECDRSDQGKLEERTIRQTVSRYHRRLADGNFGLAKKHSVPDDARWAVSRQDDNRVGVWRLA